MKCEEFEQKIIINEFVGFGLIMVGCIFILCGIVDVLQGTIDEKTIFFIILYILCALHGVLFFRKNYSQEGKS